MYTHVHEAPFFAQIGRLWGRGGGSRDVCTLPGFDFAYAERRGEKRASSLISACCRRLCRVFYSFFAYMCVRMCKKKMSRGMVQNWQRAKRKVTTRSWVCCWGRRYFRWGKCVGKSATARELNSVPHLLFSLLGSSVARPLGFAGDEGKKEHVVVSVLVITPSHTRIKKEVKPCK